MCLSNKANKNDRVVLKLSVRSMYKREVKVMAYLQDYKADNKCKNKDAQVQSLYQYIV